LEDVHLAGAKGILVNITAGDDLRMGEFEEVGNTIKGFSSENATVVVGTVFDSAMSDEVRVTVVATGIGHEAKIGPETVTGKPKPVVEIDYKILDRPTVIRKNRDKELPALEKANPSYLDIPAFLRRQAD
jgi:cell division protein FtsZ